MAANPIGNLWLKEHFGLKSYHLTHTSFTGTRLRKEVDELGAVTETYPPHYYPGTHPLDHVSFSLKYDDLNLDLLTTIFSKLGAAAVSDYIKPKFKSAYNRRIGFLYEFLTGQELPLANQPKANYIDLLDSAKYVAGKVVKNSRWLVNDNLLGNRNFCPVMRKTPALAAVLEEPYKNRVEQLAQQFPREVFYRAVNYLYTNETRSSFQIEREEPSPERTGRFIQLLQEAGARPTVELLSEPHLTGLQNRIVDSRFAATGFRDFQNYIGQTTLAYRQLIHYVCPPQQFVHSLMSGLADAAMKTKGIHAVVRATVTAFGFVFIHPFEDGNGRLHRFLIHDMLTREGMAPKGIIIPVSANMLHHIKDYDAILEAYSKPLLQRVHYEMDDAGEMTVTNPAEVEGYFRYPDLTAQCIYLGKTIKATIEEDMYGEMEFLLHYDEAKSALREVVDMPDRQMDLFIKFLHQAGGRLPARRRKQLERLTDAEIATMERLFREVFEIA